MNPAVVAAYRQKAAALRQARAAPAAIPLSVPAPVGGWNTRDALDGMQPTDATQLDNWYPGQGQVTLRKGYAEHATGAGAGAVETLAEYNAGATRKLLAAGGGAIYDASAAGAATSLGTGFTSNRWQWANFNANMLLVNGADTPQVFNGSTLANTTITGPTVAALVGVHVHKNRVYVWENQSQSFWYGATDAIGGAFTEFPLSRVSQLGGNIVAVSTMTIDGGAGPDDLAVFLMSSGEAIIYQGSDPGSASSWSLVGRFNIGAPINIRAVVRYGGDLYITTETDHVSLSSWLAALRNGVPPPRSKASGAVIAAAANASGFGWQSVMYPKGGYLLFNIPNLDGTFDQHVMNMVTGAWSRFRSIPARCWGLFNNDLYFGGAGGKVFKADTGNTDNGAAIVADGIQAWSNLGSPQRKRITAIRPAISSVGSVSYSIGISYDFLTAAVSAPSPSDSAGSPWDTSAWDTSPWSSELSADLRWRTASGTGQHIGVRLRVSGKQAISWYRTDFRGVVGGRL